MQTNSITDAARAVGDLRKLELTSREYLRARVVLMK
jgi:hypothetical protein